MRQGPGIENEESAGAALKPIGTSQKSDKASTHPNATRAQRTAKRKLFESIVWKGVVVGGLTLREIADQNDGLSKSAAQRMMAKSLRKWAEETKDFIEERSTIETIRAEDRTRIVNDIMRAEGVSDEMKLQCIDRLEKISARLSKLLGLDAATKVIVRAEVASDHQRLADAFKEHHPETLKDLLDTLDKMGAK